jgi:hypothetical protein
MLRCLLPTAATEGGAEVVGEGERREETRKFGGGFYIFIPDRDLGFTADAHIIDVVVSWFFL